MVFLSQVQSSVGFAYTVIKIMKAPLPFLMEEFDLALLAVLCLIDFQTRFIERVLNQRLTLNFGFEGCVLDLHFARGCLHCPHPAVFFLGHPFECIEITFEALCDLTEASDCSDSVIPFRHSLGRAL